MAIELCGRDLRLIIKNDETSWLSYNMIIVAKCLKCHTIFYEVFGGMGKNTLKCEKCGGLEFTPPVYASFTLRSYGNGKYPKDFQKILARG